MSLEPNGTSYNLFKEIILTMSYTTKIKKFTALLSLLAFFDGVARAEPNTWEIDPEHFSIVFETEHIGYQSQLGFFLKGGGEFHFDTETFEFFSGHVEIETSSIFTNSQNRDEHLRGKDFLNSRRHPTALFEANEFVPNQQRSGGDLKGNLTLLGTTHPITLHIILNKQAKYPFGHRKETIGISASTVISRSRYGMDYGVSNDMVGDTVILRFEFEATQK